MIKHVFAGALAFALAISATACSSSTSETGDGVKMPSLSKDFEGEQYQDVVESLEDAGFTNIETTALGNLITGWLNGEGEVDEVAVDGDADFSKNTLYPADAKIMISYHSFPLDEEESTTPAPVPSANAVQEAAQEILTVENNADLAALLALGDYCDSSVADFAASHQGWTISFDGNIGALANHGDAKTRYDILIGAGDFSETSQRGPAFQFRDVNTTYDLQLSGDNIPDVIQPGQNIHATARIGSYESASCLFLIEPVSTEFR